MPDEKPEFRIITEADGVRVVVYDSGGRRPASDVEALLYDRAEALSADLAEATKEHLRQNPFRDMEVIVDGALHFIAHDGSCQRCMRSHPAVGARLATRQALADALDAALAASREECERLRREVDSALDFIAAIASPGTTQDYGNGWATEKARAYLRAHPTPPAPEGHGEETKP